MCLILIFFIQLHCSNIFLKPIKHRRVVNYMLKKEETQIEQYN